MKKRSILFMLLVGLTLTISSCSEDDDGGGASVDAPDITEPTSPSVQVDQSTSINFQVNAPGKIASVSVSASAGTAAIANEADVLGKTSATVEVTYEAPATAGNHIVTLTVTDNQDPAKSEEEMITVIVTEEPQKPVVDVYPTEEGTGTVVWTSDNIYVLRGFIFVNNGQELTIEPGTVIKGQPGQGAGASALIVARGGRLVAEGTAEDPIIFTGLADELDGTTPDDANSLWGGLILLGHSSNNANSVDNLLAIEGIPETEPRGIHGPDDDFPLDEEDDSGILRYVSVRHGGSSIGADNEINGITLGSVGSGTVIENVEVFSNLDDGIEFFGGTVNVKNAIFAYSGDDGIDVDNGFTGSVQNAIVWHTSGTLESSDPSGAELDGATGDDESATGTPFATPILANITFVFDDAGDNSLTQALNIRDNYGGSLYNSIMMGHDGPIQIEKTSASSSSWDLFADGTLKIANNIFYNINGASAAGAEMVKVVGDPENAEAFGQYIAGNNVWADPGFGTGADRFKPSAAEATANVKEGLSTLNEALQDHAYKGAIDPDAATYFFANWSKTWSVIQ